MMPTCPRQNCEQDMIPEIELGERVQTSEVMGVRCPRCGHSGLTAGEALHLVFRAGQEYCFTFGSTPAYLSVWITTEAIGAYQPLGFTQDMLARYAAEWLLLWGRRSGLFILSPDQPGFRGFDHYLQHFILQRTPKVA